MRVFRSVLVLLVMAAFGVGVSACSSDDGTSGSSSTSSTVVETSVVTIQDFKFQPANFKVKVGAKITVTNKDTAAHTLTAKDGTFDTGTLGLNQSAEITFTKAGKFEYLCSFHSGMTGTVEVSP